MSRSHIDREFDRYRSSGDPRALATVFDATAGELYRLAWHLTGDRHVAEDLVQSTFLAAIQDAGSFTPGRSVLPWLWGILANRARAANRRARSRRAARARARSRSGLGHPAEAAEAAEAADAGEAAEAAKATGAADPVEEAATREFEDALRERLRALHEPYRRTLILHLWHGLGAKEIAELDGCPTATAQSRIQRGLELVRRGLPAGFSVMLSCAVLPAQSLAAMRDVVLGAAKLAAPASVAASAATAGLATSGLATSGLGSMAFGGVLLMKKVLLITAAILGVTSVGYLVWPDGPVGDVAGGGGLPSEQAGTAAQDTMAAGKSAPPGGRRLVSAGTTNTKRTTMVKGRCIDAATMRPLAGCRIRLHGRLDGRIDRREYERQHGKITWTDPEPRVTGPDGVFEIAFEPPPDFYFQIDVGAEGHVSYEGSGFWIEAGAARDYGDVVLALGCGLIGSVVDESGVAQAGVGVSLQGSVGSWKDLKPDSTLSAKTGPGGRFAIDKRLAEGRWIVAVRDRELLSPTWIRVENQRGSEDIKILVRDESKIPSIIGTVVDESGQPLPGVGVSCFSGRNSEGRGCRSGKDGRFVLKQHREDSATVGLRFRLRGHDPKRVKDVAWGTKDLRVMMKRGLGLTLLVLDGTTSRPVEEFGLIRYQPQGYNQQSWASVSEAMGKILHRGRHRDGRLELSGLRRGTWVFAVEPGNAGLAMSREHRVEIADGGPRQLVVKVFPPVEREVFVHTSNGQPVPGTRIELAASINGAPVSLEQQLVDRHKPELMGTGKLAWRMGSAKTDAAGKAVVRGSRNVTYAIRVLGPGHQPVVVQPVRLDPNGDRLDVEVSLGATLRGRVRPLDVVRQYWPSEDFLEARDRARTSKGLSKYLPGLLLRNLDTKARVQEAPGRRGGRRTRVPISDDGSFEIRGVAPGSWQLVLVYTEAGDGGWSSSEEKLQEVHRLQDGKEREIEVDISHLRRSLLKGVVMVNGQPVPDAFAQLLRVGLDKSAKPGLVGSTGRKTGADGRFQLLLSPGRYWLLLSYPVQGTEQWTRMCPPSPFTVVAGRDVERKFSLHAGRARLRLVGHDGKPVAGVRLMAREVGDWPSEIMPSGFRTEPTDKEGRTTTPLRKATRFEVRIWPRRLSDKARQELRRKGGDAYRAAQVLLGTIEIEPGSKEPAWQKLVVPKSAGY